MLKLILFKFIKLLGLGANLLMISATKSNKKCIVQNVVMGECGTFGLPGRSACVLNVDWIIRLHAGLNLFQFSSIFCSAHPSDMFEFPGPVEFALVLVENDQIAQFWECIGAQTAIARRRIFKFRNEFA